MQSNKTWGGVFHSGGEEGEEDPVKVLIQQVETLKKQGLVCGPNETVADAEARRNEEINKLEHKISDAIYIKNQNKMFKK